MTVQLGQITKLLTDLACAHQVVGAQLAVYYRGRTLSLETGRERCDGRPRVGPDSAFPFGSVTKLVNATVVMRLVGEGRIGLDEPVETYVRELRSGRRERAGLVTPRQLLSHTSGLPADFSPAAEASLSLRDYTALCRDLAPLYPAGWLYSYSNVGSAIAGRLVEVTTGMDWWTAVRTTLLEPLGMGSVRLVEQPADRPVASGHVVGADGPIPIVPSCPVPYVPAGGLVGTARDLVSLGRLHVAASRQRIDLLDDDSRMLSRDGAGGVGPFGSTAEAGLGLHRFNTERGHWFGHDGTLDGTTCHLRFDPTNRLVVALLTNTTRGGDLWEDLVPGLAEAGLDVSAETVPARPAAPGVDPPDCLGDYRSGDMRYSVRPGRDGSLMIRAGSMTLTDVTFHPGLVFSAPGATGHRRPVMGRFLCDPDGRAISLLEIGGRVARREPVM